MLEKILLNLLSNAYKFTFEGRIELRVRIGERAVIEVADTGVGIPEDELPRLFERFHRVEGARGRSHEGSGIGLALVRELGRAARRRGRCPSAVGAGTHVPRRAAAAPADVGRRARTQRPARSTTRCAPGSAQEALRWGGERARDRGRPPTRPRPSCSSSTTTPTCASTSRGCCERYAVRTAVDGEDALEQLRERRADLVLTDVMMPRMDGLELLAAAARGPAHAAPARDPAVGARRRGGGGRGPRRRRRRLPRQAVLRPPS